MTEPRCPPDPEVARVGVCEIALVVELHAESFPQEVWSAASLAQILALPGSFGLLALGGGQALGFVLARVAAGECEILTLTVRPGARRRGVARGMLGAALAQAVGLGSARVHLEVAEDNAAARALYAATGFKASGRREDYYGNGAATPKAAILLTRTLP